MADSNSTFIGLAILTLALSVTATSSAYAQQGEDLREAAQNPIADLISVPFQNNTNFDIGRTDNTQNVLNIQPVYPTHLNETWNLITRPILPVIYQPPFFQGEELRALETILAPNSVIPNLVWGISLQNFSFRQESRSSLVPTQAWYGVWGQRFNFQPRQTTSLDRENGLPGPDLSCSCLTGHCT